MEQEQSSARRRFTPEEKFRIVKEQLTTKTSVSEICRKYGISPGNFYSWQELFFSGAMAGFDRKRGPKADVSKANQRTEQMESEISRMREVIAEITAENIGFKKKFSGFPVR